MKSTTIHLSGILLCIVMLMALTVAVSAASCEEHDFVNGFCTVCDNCQYAPLKNGAYEIGNAGQLYWFAKRVNSGQTDICGKLVADITVNDRVLAEDGTLAVDGSGLRKWKPIADPDAPYVGTFDGNGKTISGLYLDDPEEDHAGLFGRIGPEGVVKGVTIADSWLRIWLEAKDEIDCGGIAGENYGTIRDCHNGASISNNESYVGGIAGYNAGGASIIGCTNTGVLSGNILVGGITAQSMGLLKDCINYGPVSADLSRCGGITGSLGVPIFGDDGQMENCHNLGSVEALGSVGGIVGELAGFNASFRRCSNAGPVYGNSKVGGLVGDIWSGVKVYDSFNTGSVSGTRFVGGLGGYIDSRSGFFGCFNTGMVTGGGGLFGWAAWQQEAGEPINTPYVRCYYLAGTASCDVWEDEPQQAVFARPAIFFTSGTLAWELNEGVTDGSQLWYQDLGKDEIPGFSGGTVYRITEPCGSFSNKTGTVGRKEHLGNGSYSCIQEICCGDCGDLLGHNYQISVVDPTCQREGYTVYRCQPCGHCYMADYTAPAHRYEDSFCVECGKLETPQILSCYSANATSVKITWSRVTGADRYQIYRMDPSKLLEGWTLVKTIKSNDITSYTNQSLTPGQTYRYKIRAYVDLPDGERRWSDFSQEEYVPGAVQFDGPYSNSPSRIRLRWQWVEGAHGYQIWRKDEGGAYRVVKTIMDGNVTAYSNTSLISGGRYTYKIRAFRITEAGGKVYGVYSEEVTVAVQPAAPDFTLSSTKAGQVKLVWDPVSGAGHYQIWMSDRQDGDFQIVKSIYDGDVTSYTKMGLVSGKTYYFKLRASVEVDGKKTFGAYSEIIAITVK